MRIIQTFLQWKLNKKTHQDSLQDDGPKCACGNKLRPHGQGARYYSGEGVPLCVDCYTKFLHQWD